MRVWYFLIGGLDTPFRGGEYLFKLIAPDEFPQKPPKFEFLTKNGVYTPGGPICISVGDFHTNDDPARTGRGGGVRLSAWPDSPARSSTASSAGTTKRTASTAVFA